MFVIDTDNQTNLELELYDGLLSAIYEKISPEETMLERCQRSQFGNFLEHYIGKNISKLATVYSAWQEEKMENCSPGDFKPIGNSEDFIKRFIDTHYDERGDI
jgi:hypothetical protein